MKPPPHPTGRRPHPHPPDFPHPRFLRRLRNAGHALSSSLRDITRDPPAGSLIRTLLPPASQAAKPPPPADGFAPDPRKNPSIPQLPPFPEPAANAAPPQNRETARLTETAEFPQNPPLPAPANTPAPTAEPTEPVRIAGRGLELILTFEGLDQPWRWPGAYSGITLGRGYDLGHHHRDEFLSDWAGHLSPHELTRLAAATGRRGPAARRMAPSFRDILIRPAAADAVFAAATLPRIHRATATAFPGISALPADAQGALASLVFNRGSAMEGSRRREMRAIRDAIALPHPDPATTLAFIASQLRAMKRLWPKTSSASGHPGLRRRREAEARLVESALPSIQL